MASILVCPSDAFLATYSLVRSSVLSLPMATMWIAEFACLSPPRLSLCRYVIPDETGTGSTPQGMAKDASDLSLSGLSPTVTIGWAADWAPTHLSWTSSGAASASIASIMSSSSETSSSRST